MNLAESILRKIVAAGLTWDGYFELDEHGDLLVEVQCVQLSAEEDTTTAGPATQLPGR